MPAELHVETVGAGPPLVLLHGWGMHGGLWMPVLPPLAARHRVHVVDLPGHGHSAAAGPVTLAAIVTRLAAHFAAERELAVLGWSLGALVAMQWALAAPGQVLALVLVAATPCFVSTEDWPHAIDDDALLRFGDELRVSYRLTLQRFLSLQLQGTDHGRATLAGMRQTLFARGEPRPAALEQGLEILRTTDLRGDVQRIRQRSLVLAGDRDMLAPVAAARALAAGMPHADLVVLPGAGHVPFLSHPDAFVQAVTGFLDG